MRAMARRRASNRSWSSSLDPFFLNPLGKLILGGRPLLFDTQKYIVNLIEHDELSEMSAALKTITKDWMQCPIRAIGNTGHPSSFPEQYWQYKWDWVSVTPTTERAFGGSSYPRQRWRPLPSRAQTDGGETALTRSADRRTPQYPGLYAEAHSRLA